MAGGAGGAGGGRPPGPDQPQTLGARARGRAENLKQKTSALVALGAVSLAGPLAERAVTGQVEEFGRWAVVETLVTLALVFWWYHQDKAEHGYRAGPLMNGGMLLLALVAMPVYLVRTRGWKRGAIAIARAAAIFAALVALEEAGEWLGGFFGP